MKTLPLFAPWLVVALGLGTLAACTGEESFTPNPSGAPRPGEIASGGGLGTGGGDSVGGGGGSVAPSCGALGLQVEVDGMADGGCVDAPYDAVAIYPADDVVPVFTRLVPAGDGWVAGGGVALEGFAVLDDRGVGLSPGVVDVTNAFAFDGEHIVAASRRAIEDDYYDVVLSAYDLAGEPLDDELLQVATGQLVEAVWVGTGAAGTLVAWALPGQLRARVVGPEGALGPELRFGSGTFQRPPTLHVADDGAGGFAIAWSGDPEPGRSRTFVTTTDGGSIRTPLMTLADGCEHHEIADLVPSAGGYVALINGRDDVYVMGLDDEATPVGSALRLEGMIRGWDLEGTSDGVAVMATRRTGEAALRRLDAELEPEGDWNCLSPPAEEVLGAAIAVHEEGLAATVWDPTQSQAMFLTVPR